MKSRILLFLIFAVSLAVPRLTLTAHGEEKISAFVQDALASTLAGDATSVILLREILEEDENQENQPPSGVVDDLRVLEILASDQPQHEKARSLRKLANSLNDPVAKERLHYLSGRVTDVRMEELKRKRKYNKVVNVINRTWRTASEVVTGQPRALAVAGTDLVFHLTGRDEPAVADKKIAYLARLQEAEGQASDKELGKARRFIDKVEGRKSKALLRQWKRNVKSARKGDEWPRVARLSRTGLQLWPEEDWFEDRLAEADAHLDTHEFNEYEKITTSYSDESDPRLTLLRKKLATPPDPVRRVSDRRAREKIGSAYSERKSKTLNYLLLGNTRAPLSLHQTARSTALHGADAPAALGITQAAQTVMRGATLLFGNNLGVEKTIDTYADIHRRTPEALSEEDYKKWADLCSKSGNHEEALEILENAGIGDERRVRRYRKRWASEIVGRCEDLPASGDRFRALSFVLEEFPETSAAGKARELLEETPNTEKPLVFISTEDLQSHRDDLLGRGLSFSEQWWDGAKNNGEIAGDGVYWDPDGTLWYQTGKRSPWRVSRQEKESLPALRVTFQEIEERMVARKLKDQRRGERLFPIEIEGELGPSSSYVTPKFVGWELDQDPEGLFE